MFIHKHFSANNVSIEQFPFTRELAMEAYLLENECILGLDAGLEDVTIVESEVPLNGKQKIDGRMDILALYNKDTIGIIELKLGTLEEKHLQQLETYLEKKDQILNKFKSKWNKEKIWNEDFSGKAKWIGIMVGKNIDPELATKISLGHNKDSIPIAALTINRFKGVDGNIYVVTDTYYCQKKNTRNFDKFHFNGNEYGKGPLVLAVVKHYVDLNPSIGFYQLKEKFPDKLGGNRDTSHVFTEYHEAEIIQQRNPEKPHKRHFLNSDQTIILSDGKRIAVSNQWGDGKKGNFRGFLNHCKNVLNFDIREIRN